MRVVPEGGEAIDLGTVETTPTIGIVDYSRRVTDDFGVTTVVRRGFSRRMSVRLALPSDTVDEVRRTFEAVRAQPAQWIASDDFAWLNFEGFYKDFEIDLALPPLSFCTLTVEGLAETETVPDTGEEAAPDGGISSLLLVQPVDIGEAELVASDVAEDDYAAWSAGNVYTAGARVLRAPSHRIYESAADGNTGNDPTGASGLWIDVGPTNRWAMFDQALGTSTARDDGFAVTLAAGPIEAVALLDVVGATVRVQTTGYDQTQPVVEGAIVFLDLPAVDEDVIVTIAGTGETSVGTLLVGHIATLGRTGDSPTAGITDYSRKETDDFGEVTLVERAFAKRMSARAIISTSAVDLVANRIAAVRARPSLWIADTSFDSLIVYGFFKDFSIEVGENVSVLSLSVEGLSKAAPLASPDDATEPPTSNGALPPSPISEGHLWFDPNDGQHGYRQDGTTLTDGGFPVTDGGEPIGCSGWVSIRDGEASRAGELADAAIDDLYALGEDGILTGTEKRQALIPRSASLESAYTALVAAAATVGVSSTAAAAARTDWISWRDSLVPAWNDAETDTSVDRVIYRTKLEAYDAALENLARAVTEAASIELTLAPNVVTIRATAAGTPYDDELPVTFVPALLSGTTNRNAGATWSMTLSPTLAGTQDTTSNTASEGAVTITTATGDGSITVSAEGKTATARLVVQRDAAPPPTEAPGGGVTLSTSTVYGAVTLTTFPADPPEIKTIRSASSGDVEFVGSWEYGGNNRVLAGKLVYRVAGSGGAWNDVAAQTTGSASGRTYEDYGETFEVWNGIWQQIVTITLTASTDYEWGTMLRRAGSSASVTPFGMSQAKQP
ncbi:hypothetical protein BWQ93_05955 [Sphingopyxis sp. QXT-31]|uniref:hypothetical protein n=1 Tax=Sphingopyxis sp. QXT-31 TaxID=1357916 RepID=UPI000979127D|nr:hypothetical protein [Sphingopyxis sp. QXT-31]APZ98074.1 hypothetical protein BWQ93_05955 [Sphingopyxis sp. QXT-31]